MAIGANTQPNTSSSLSAVVAQESGDPLPSLAVPPLHNAPYKTSWVRSLARLRTIRNFDCNKRSIIREHVVSTPVVHFLYNRVDALI